jgi:hypothetical protein
MCVMMNSPEEGKDEEFNRWYTGQHVPDVMRVPGFETAQRFKLSGVQHKQPPFSQRYVAFYEIDTDNLADVDAEIVRRVGTSEMPMSNTISPPVVRFFLDEVTDRIVKDAAHVDAVPANRHLMCVMTVPAPGKEAEFERWYNEQHFQDLLDLPGLVAAQRYRLSPVQPKAPPFPQTYLAMYELETDSLEAFNAELVRRAGTSEMPLTDALGPGFVRFLLDAVTERQVKGDPVRFGSVVHRSDVSPKSSSLQHS